MGRNDKEAEERPAHEVRVDDFYVDKTEVTNQQYKKFIDATGYAAPYYWKAGTFLPGESLLPVVGVTWHDASAFSKWAGKRLLREAEWEYIARNGGKTMTYPWGEVWLKDAANVSNESEQRFSVNSFEKDISLGVYDLVGNVSEWVEDFYSPYDKSSNYQAGSFKIYRGGNFQDGVQAARATKRWFVEPDVPQNRAEYVFHKVGFRCAKSAQ